MRPVIRGRHAAVASMKAEATEAARQILDYGRQRLRRRRRRPGRAGSHGLLAQRRGERCRPSRLQRPRQKSLFHQCRASRAQSSPPSSGTRKTTEAKFPRATACSPEACPACSGRLVHAARPLGHDELRAGSAARDRPRRKWFPAERILARLTSPSRRRFSSIQLPSKSICPTASRPRPARSSRIPDLARTLKKLVEAEKANHVQRPTRGAQSGARPLLQRRHCPANSRRSPRPTGAYSATRTLPNTLSEVETPVSINYRGYQVYKNPSASQGPTELIALNHSRGLRPQGFGPQQPGLSAHQRGSRKARYGRPREISRRHGLHQDPLRWPALERLCPRTQKADRSRESLAGTAPRFAREVRRELITVRAPSTRGPRRGRQPRRRHQLHCRRRQGSQHGQLRAQPAQPVWDRRGHGRYRHYLQLPRRLLFAGSRRGERPRTRQTPAQYPAEHVDS